MDRQKLVFQPAEILLPAGDLRRWSVIACDQFTSNGAYWRSVEEIVGDAPSARRLVLPEYYLGRCDEDAAARKIQQTMRAYLAQDVFRTLPDSLVYVERTLSDGAVRRGIVGMIDLEAYNYASGSGAPIRATESTVEDRLPPRIKVRREACLEMPHVLLFLNDPEDAAMREAKRLSGEMLYDFELMNGGGHLAGHRISGKPAWKLAELISAGDGTLRFAVGDGNHSLAAARNFWLEKRRGLSPEERTRHPARYALVELVNIHDPAVEFRPIHRVLFETDSEAWFREANKMLSDPNGYEIVLLRGDERLPVQVGGRSLGELIDRTERFCREYCARHGGEIDYIHGDDEAAALSAQPGCCGALLPQMDKADLFSSIELTGTLPRKSFSIGLGSEKRYYLECRKIE